MGRFEFKSEILRLKTVIVNEMAKGDLQKLKSIIFKEGINPMDYSYEDDPNYKMNRLGHGQFGQVYEFIGSDGYEYAVKIARYDSERCKENDGQILEKLQGIEGYPKLFCYFEGSVSVRSWGETVARTFIVMVSKKVFGFTIDTGNRIEYCRKMFYNNCREDILTKFVATLEKTFEVGYLPADVHYENVMIDMYSGTAVIVDVGYFKRKEDEHALYEERNIRGMIESSRLEVLCLKTNNTYGKESKPKFSLEVKEYAHV